MEKYFYARNERTRGGQRWGDFIYHYYCECYGSIKTWWSERGQEIGFFMFQNLRACEEQKLAQLVSLDILSLRDLLTCEKIRKLMKDIYKLKMSYGGQRGWYDTIIQCGIIVIDEIICR